MSMLARDFFPLWRFMCIQAMLRAGVINEEMYEISVGHSAESDFTPEELKRFAQKYKEYKYG